MRSPSAESEAESSRTDIYGEVFTPPVLIHELLDQLPKRVWTDPELRWLDPCAGRGNFVDEILPRLMDGLSDHFRRRGGNAACRRHILEQMITQVELNPDNVTTLRSKYGGRRARILVGDFLDPATMGEAHDFDVILANPPYQSPKTEAYTGSAGNRTLWDLFVHRALELVKPTTGVLGFITPSNWRRPGHPLWSLLRHRILYLHIYDKTAGRTHFKVQTRFDLYVLQPEAAKPDAAIPEVVDERGEHHRGTLYPRDWPFFPNFMYSTLLPYVVNDPDTGIDVLHDSSTYDARKLTRRPTAAHPYPIVHTLTMKGIGLRYAAVAPEKQPKVILNVNEKQYPVNDWRGKYGMSQLSFGIPISTRREGERWLAFMHSPVFQDLLRATKWGSFQTDHRMFSYFRRDLWRLKAEAEDGGTKKKRAQRGNPTRKNRPIV